MNTDSTVRFTRERPSLESIIFHFLKNTGAVKSSMEATPTWVLVADNAQARVFDYHGPKHSLEIVDGGSFRRANKPTRELNSEGQGVLVERRSTRPGADRRNPRGQEKHQFAQELSSYLDQHGDDFEQLILAAPPRMLGYLREHLSRNQLNKTIAAIDKDLTSASEAELAKELQCYVNTDTERSIRA